MVSKGRQLNMSKNVSNDQLTDKQIHTLKLLYKFRFISSPLLRDYRDQKSDVPVTRALKLLVDKGYVLRRYKKSYRLAGKPASFALAPKALTYLRDKFGLDETVLHSYYKNKSVSDEFIDHHLKVLSAYLGLRNSSSDKGRIFTKYEIAQLEELPEIKPDLFFVHNQEHTLIYIYEDSQLFVIKKQLKKIYEFYESEDNSGISLMVLCKNGGQERALSDYLEGLQDAYDIDFKVHVSTVKAFLNVA